MYTVHESEVDTPMVSIFPEATSTRSLSFSVECIPEQYRDWLFQTLDNQLSLIVETIRLEERLKIQKGVKTLLGISDSDWGSK